MSDRTERLKALHRDADRLQAKVEQLKQTPDAESQLDELAHHPGPVTGAPLLDGALATLECRTFAVYDGGDHSIIVGRVAAVDSPADPPARGPLIHHAGRYHRLRPTED